MRNLIKNEIGLGLLSLIALFLVLYVASDPVDPSHEFTCHNCTITAGTVSNDLYEEEHPQSVESASFSGDFYSSLSLPSKTKVSLEGEINPTTLAHPPPADPIDITVSFYDYEKRESTSYLRVLLTPDNGETIHPGELKVYYTLPGSGGFVNSSHVSFELFSGTNTYLVTIQEPVLDLFDSGHEILNPQGYSYTFYIRSLKGTDAADELFKPGNSTFSGFEFNASESDDLESGYSNSKNSNSDIFGSSHFGSGFVHFESENTRFMILCLSTPAIFAARVPIMGHSLKSYGFEKGGLAEFSNKHE
ncbi:hypothetical protein [Methanolapillus ohkumae]|uniref:Uncharacterized protein n=1 Tax=Methanolapillus ohkumae TaxID=3028298 RepID=A0AA96V890_9EURY|nr:hypothetical protein MsAm2_14590 [Methanosarcinaceae archaeon Am2]